MVPTFKTTCLSKLLIAPSVYELHVEKPTDFSFQPGQFMLFDVPLLDHENDVQARAYSIASAGHEQELKFIIKLVPNGRASQWIKLRVAHGTPITMKGPFGTFTLDRETKKPYVFIATGTGVAPMRSHILWALEEQHELRPMHLLFGVVRTEDMFWEQEWKTLESKHANFHAHFSSLIGGSAWHTGKSSIQEQLPQIVPDLSQVSVYICGAPDFVKDLKQRCLEWGMQKSDIHSESYL